MANTYCPFAQGDCSEDCNFLNKENGECVVFNYMVKSIEHLNTINTNLDGIKSNTEKD